MKILKKLSLLLLAFPCCTFALGLNDYFQQGFEIDNQTQKIIIASDANTAVTLFQNVSI